MSASLVLADDHPIVLEGIDSVFKLTNDLNVVAAARVMRSWKPYTDTSRIFCFSISGCPAKCF